MSTLIHARHGGHQDGPVPGRAEQKARALGLTSATGLVVGSIVGDWTNSYHSILVIIASYPVYRFATWLRTRGRAVSTDAASAS